MLLLALVGVAPDDIAADYDMSNPRLPPLWALLGAGDQVAKIEANLARRNTNARATLLDLLASLEVDAYLRSAGTSDTDMAAVRRRLLSPVDCGAGSC